MWKNRAAGEYFLHFSSKTNLSPFTKDFRGREHMNEASKKFFSALPYGGAYKTTEECSKITRFVQVSYPSFTDEWLLFATTHTYREFHRSQQIIAADHVSRQTPIRPLCFYVKQFKHTKTRGRRVETTGFDSWLMFKPKFHEILSGCPVHCKVSLIFPKNKTYPLQSWWWLEQFSNDCRK